MLQTIGVILGIAFVIACGVAAGMVLASYFIKKNNYFVWIIASRK